MPAVGPASQEPRGPGDGVVVAVAVAVATFAVLARLHDVAVYPPMYDFDAGGHAAYVLDLVSGRLPDPRSWSGSHPPLYYGIGAALWRLLPEAVPVHVMLRAISAAAWVATVGLIWRTLRRLGFGIDGCVAATLLLGVPGMVIASCMMTNDPLCALLVTATVVRLVEAPRAPSAAHAAWTGVLAGLAAATKATGVAAIATAVLFYAWRSRREPARILRNTLAVGLVAAALAAPHFARLFLALPGSAYQVLGARAGSEEKEVIGWIVYAAAPTRRLFDSWAGVLHASLWGDPLGVFLSGVPPPARLAMSVAGLLVTAVVMAGTVRASLRPALVGGAAVALGFGLLYAAALFPLVTIGPYLVLTKINYLLPEALPLALLAAIGVGSTTGGARTVLRAALLTIAAGGVLLTWYGLAPASATVRPFRLDGAVPGSALATVERYFAFRARDPVRAADLLAPEAHLAHGLRLATMLRVPLAPEPETTPENARALELARARVAWLDLYNLVRWVQPVAAALDVRVTTVNQQRDAADVGVRVGAAETTRPAGGAIGLWPFPPFEQRFELRRAGGAWRIVRITQSAVVAESSVPAFVAAPTLEGLDRLRALGWRPSWEDAVAALER